MAGRPVARQAFMMDAVIELKISLACSCAAQVLCAGAIFPPDPEDDFQIEWLSDYTSTTVRRKDLYRHQLPLSRNTVKGWLQLSATAETAHVSTSVNHFPGVADL